MSAAMWEALEQTACAPCGGTGADTLNADVDFTCDSCGGSGIAELVPGCEVGARHELCRKCGECIACNEECACAR